MKRPSRFETTGPKGAGANPILRAMRMNAGEPRKKQSSAAWVLRKRFAPCRTALVISKLWDVASLVSSQILRD